MFRIATRGSDLALAQTEYIQARLESLGYKTEQLIVKTTGDVNLAPFALASGDERKGLFTKEIEDALLAGEADIAVHSYKDLPSVSVPELMIAAIPQRLDSRDYFIFKKKDQVSDTFPYIRADARIGTSSVRRRSQLLHLLPALQVMELRGNVPTRVRRLFEEGGPEGILLSGAGVQRLIEQKRFVEEQLLEQLAIMPVDVETLVPAPAQGTLAVQCRVADSAARDALAKLHDSSLAEILSVERGVLAALEGGCHLPLGIQAHAQDGFVEASVYLGKEFLKTRYPYTVQFTRRHVEPAVLREFLIAELKDASTPLYVFGKKDRMQSLSDSHTEARCIGVIETRPLLDKLPELPDQTVVGCFSADAVRLIEKLDARWFKNPTFVWGVPGEKTAEMLLQRGVRSQQIVIGDDGTGAGLARSLLAARESRLVGRRIVGLSAAAGREEFYDLITAVGLLPERVEAYATEAIEIPASTIASIQDDAFLIFGSPSSFHAFAASLDRVKRDWSKGWRICSIGKTTSEAIRLYSQERGVAHLSEPYMTAVEPDYDRMIKELLAK
jgi:hydroxymethylbilane synthase